MNHFCFESFLLNDRNAVGTDQVVVIVITYLYFMEIIDLFTGVDFFAKLQIIEINGPVL